MTIKQLKRIIKNKPDDLEVFLRGFINPCGNIAELLKIDLSKYSFFGESIDCLILEPSDGMNKQGEANENNV